MVASSWEDNVSWVTIGSSSPHITESAKTWDGIFSDLDTVRNRVDVLKQRISDAWRGETAKAFTVHLTNVEKALTDIAVMTRRIATGLRDARAHLDHAVSKIPVPDWVAEEAKGRMAYFKGTGELKAYHTNEFYETMPWSAWVTPAADASVTLGPVQVGVRDRFWYAYHSWAGTADSYRATLMDEYNNDARTIGTGERVPSPQISGGLGSASARAAGTRSSGLGAGTRSSDLGSGALSTGVSPPSFPAAGLGAAGMPPGLGGGLSASGLDPGTLSTSGLNPSGTPVPAGTGLAGLGPLGGAGGLGPDGIGGIGALSSGGLGPLVTPAMMAGEVGAMDATRLATGLGAAGMAGLSGANSSAMGMMPAGAGTGMMPDADGETGTKLIEDDKNIFGPPLRDRDLPGDVIG
jgi:uncharacterized protein YukE